MGEISAAGTGQSAGVENGCKAVDQTDRAPLQNVAQVDKSAFAADCVETQAN